MIPLILLLAAVLGALAWRFPQHRAVIGAALVAVVLAGWVWFEYGAERRDAASGAIAPDTLVLDGIAFEPWSGEHRLHGTATNRSADVVLIGFDARLHLRDCVDGECAPLGVHAQRINIRIPPGEAVAFERRIRLAPGIVSAARGEITVEIEVVEIHGRPDLHRAGGVSTRAD